jgi:hypothetical protein
LAPNFYATRVNNITISYNDLLDKPVLLQGEQGPFGADSTVTRSQGQPGESIVGPQGPPGEFELKVNLHLIFRFTLDSTSFRECGTSLPTTPKIRINVLSMLFFNARSSAQPTYELITNPI